VPPPTLIVPFDPVIGRSSSLNVGGLLEHVLELVVAIVIVVLLTLELSVYDVPLPVGAEYGGDPDVNAEIKLPLLLYVHTLI
jgi:hypothetical protein